MNYLNNTILDKIKRPIRVLQFGQGNFIRGFADLMIDIANERGVFNGDIVIVKPTKSAGDLDVYKKQDFLYTVVLKGIENGKVKKFNHIVKSIADIVHPYLEYEKYAELTKIKTLRFVISNTTEAGIVYDDKDTIDMKPPNSFPGKLTKFLYERYIYFKGDKDKGLIILPLELIDNNGDELKNVIMKYIKLWNLEEGFLNWLDEACEFCNSLVDRIITGFSDEYALAVWEELGYRDDLLVAGETFGLWAIQDINNISSEFPLHKANQSVIFTKDLSPYELRKVRILNGAHIAFALASYLSDNDYVLESMEDQDIRTFMTKAIYDEIIPSLDLPKDDLTAFADSVIERFRNPYNKHPLLSISLNGVSKWKYRILPSILDYIDHKGELPFMLTFSIAALIEFYRGLKEQDNGVYVNKRHGEEYLILDDNSVIEFFKINSQMDDEVLVKSFLSVEEFWDQDLNKLPGFSEAVRSYLRDINDLGMREAIRKVNSMAMKGTPYYAGSNKD
ncbi:MAG: tagaturonate reductase [Anaerolineaceae bacterium]|nr:MAG: tagaturonate reductase [Anaerolineaceae bacterium]